jgi:hypothetical protein
MRLPQLESRARFIASLALTAAHGYAPSPKCAPYVSPEVFRHLVAQARNRSLRQGRPEYRGRTYLCRVNRDAIEATVVATAGDVTRAVAMRLEHVNGLWRASELIVI